MPVVSTGATAGHSFSAVLLQLHRHVTLVKPYQGLLLLCSFWVCHWLSLRCAAQRAVQVERSLVCCEVACGHQRRGSGPSRWHIPELCVEGRKSCSVVLCWRRLFRLGLCAPLWLWGCSDASLCTSRTIRAHWSWFLVPMTHPGIVTCYVVVLTHVTWWF